MVEIVEKLKNGLLEQGLTCFGIETAFVLSSAANFMLVFQCFPIVFGRLTVY